MNIGRATNEEILRAFPGSKISPAMPPTAWVGEKSGESEEARQ